MSYQLKKKSTSEEATQQKASSPEEQQQEKRNEVRGLLGSLTEEMPRFLTDTTIRRFLRARSWSTEQATKGLKETVKWRREYRPDAISWEDIAEVENEARRTHVADYVDKNGRSVLVANVPMKSKVSGKEQIKHLVYLLEYFATNSADEQEDFIVWLTDFRGWSISSTPLWQTRETIHIIQNYYPGLIAVAIPFDPPRIFESFWKSDFDLKDSALHENFVQPYMREKVKFVYPNKPESRKIIADIFDLDTLESSFGGRSTTTAFDINKYAERMRRADKMRGASKDTNG